jgi:carbon monoxide dehydrogenase subunit G
MLKLAGEIVINRPPDQVFRFLTDLGNVTQWATGVSEVKVLTEGPVRLGTQFEETIRMMGRPVRTVCEVVDLAEGRKFAYKSVSSGMMTYEGQFVFEPADGGTRLRYSSTARLGGLWRLLEPLVAMEAKKETQAELQKIKSALEG